MAAILKTFAGLNFYTRACFIDYYHISFTKSHQTLRPRSCRVNQKFGPWISDYNVEKTNDLRLYFANSTVVFPDLFIDIFESLHKKKSAYLNKYMSYMQEKIYHKLE